MTTKLAASIITASAIALSFTAMKFLAVAQSSHQHHQNSEMSANDALASEWMSEQQQEEQIQRAIWLVMAANHEGMEAGKTYGNDKLHDHRFMAGMPGMGWMGDIEGFEHHNHGQNPNDHQMMNHQMNHEDNSEMNHQMDMKGNNLNTTDPEEDHTNHNH